MGLTNLQHDNRERHSSKVLLKDLTPSLKLKYIFNNFPLSREKLAQLIGVSPRTLNRWAKFGKGPERSEHITRLSKLHEILELGIKVYTAPGLRDFFKTPLSEFDHQTAFDILSIGRFDDVLGALAADYEGLGS
jgi:transcriptional regulator with XRE-family HTH domain